jgi:16S rRNA (uracil1498-N3)-methyltransferase
MTRHRIYLEPLLKQGVELELNKYHSNYICNVLRLKQGDIVSVFNSVDGEFSAEIIAADRKKCILQICDRTHVAEPLKYLGLAFAPIKNPNSSFIVEKATELGLQIFIQSLRNAQLSANLTMKSYK